MARKSQSTQKNSSTTKRAVNRSASTAKKSAASKKPRPLTWKFYAVTIGIFSVAVATVVVIALLTSSITIRQTNQARLDRIENIYTSLELGDDYTIQASNVFGDKRVYDWDKSRTSSSYIEYTRGDTVSNTVADLDKKIKAAGFTFVDEPYPGAVGVQYHYKSAKDEYVRLSVSSKPYNDAWFNAHSLKKDIPQEVYDMDKNAGPASVVIKVNLDDNNE